MDKAIGISLEDVDVKTFGAQAGLKGKYVAVPAEVPLMLTAVIQAMTETPTPALLAKAGEIMDTFFPTDVPQRMTVIEHNGKRISVPE